MPASRAVRDDWSQVQGGQEEALGEREEARGGNQGGEDREAPQEVQDVTGALWTAELIETYKNFLENSQLV